jgi:tungstate transport system ATP-binding protein
VSHSSNIFPLKIDGVQVRKRGKVLLNDISLALGGDLTTVVMGPNGSGKTTLMRLMHGLERPRQGSLQWAIPNEQARLQQSFVFQTPIMMRRRVSENLRYPLKLIAMPKQEAETLVTKWLSLTGLSGKEKLPAQFLSGGERQKLAIARAMITKPQVLFLDEPTTNLDGQSTKEIEALLATVKADGTCVVVSTHDLGQAKRLADQVIFLNKGHMCEVTAATQFFKKPLSRPAQQYLDGEIVE